MKPCDTESTKATRLDLKSKILLALAVPNGLIFVTFVALRLLGLIRPFYIPAASMTPAIAPGDHIMMEGLSYRAHKPHRGDILFFSTVGLEELPQDQIYVKRLAGKPGEHLQLSNGDLHVDGRLVTLSNAAGRIVYRWPQLSSAIPATQFDVPKTGYFVLGDNSTDSYDSRYWGSVPKENVLGRVWFCYWPLDRVGAVK